MASNMQNVIMAFPEWKKSELYDIINVPSM